MTLDGDPACASRGDSASVCLWYGILILIRTKIPYHISTNKKSLASCVLRHEKGSPSLNCEQPGSNKSFLVGLITVGVARRTRSKKSEGSETQVPWPVCISGARGVCMGHSARDKIKINGIGMNWPKIRVCRTEQHKDAPSQRPC